MAAAWSVGRAVPEALTVKLLGFLWFVSVTTRPWGAAASGGEETLKCEDLKAGQYICKDPKINDATQEPVNCTNYTAHVPCFPAPNITCKDFSGNETHFTGNEIGFLKPISCRNVNGYSYKVAVALSLFLGWLGADRFYLGYPALGLLKFCTVGFCGIGSLIDFILISMQMPDPRDHGYVSKYYSIFQPVLYHLGSFSSVLGFRVAALLGSAVSVCQTELLTLSLCGLMRCDTIVGPSDGSSYIIDYYGTRLTRLSITNETFRKTQLYP